MKIVCVGDSLTYGEGVESPAKWVDLVSAQMPEHEVLNRGVCGDTTRLILERFPEDVQRENPDVLIVQAGLNDANKWDSDRGLNRVSPEACQANLIEMSRRGRAFGATRIGFVDLTPATKPSVLPDWWRYRSMLRRAAEKCGAAVIKHPIPMICESYLQPDGVHLNERGNEAIASAVLDWLLLSELKVAA